MIAANLYILLKQQPESRRRKKNYSICMYLKTLSKVCPVDNFTYIPSLICTNLTWFIQRPIICISDVSLLYTFINFQVIISKVSHLTSDIPVFSLTVHLCTVMSIAFIFIHSVFSTETTFIQIKCSCYAWCEKFEVLCVLNTTYQTLMIRVKLSG